VDAQLDRIQLVPPPSPELRAADLTLEPTTSHSSRPSIPSSPRINELQSIIRALSTTSSSHGLLSSWRISTLLDNAQLGEPSVSTQSFDKTQFETDLEWLLVSKATAQTYGLVLNTILEQTIPLADDIWYWDEVLGSYAYSSLYTIQTSPWRFFDWTKDIYRDTRRRIQRFRDEPRDAVSAERMRNSMSAQWNEFYSLVQESVRERSVANMQRRVLSPIALARAEARKKQAGLRRLREMGASGLGVLVDEGLNFGPEEELNGKAAGGDHAEWKVVVERSVALMDMVLRKMTQLDTGVPEFEDAVFSSVEDDPEISHAEADVEGNRAAKISRRLQHILTVHITQHTNESRKLVSQYGRPSRIVRYWLPLTLGLLSSSTIFRIIVNRKADIITWVRDFGSTVRDFWSNWVVDPIKHVIGTIRHDTNSEVAIMSKDSLRGDRESLERMVVDFAVDRPLVATDAGSLTEAQIADIREKVKAGDLTPVLRAYEKDLRSPLWGTIRGDLVRTLLIQVQKTKVDVEVAMSGIDALLKSQELVFGFVGLTPGLLVSLGVFRYLGSMFGGRRGMRKNKKVGQAIRVLRNIDRILTHSTPTTNGMISYKDHGLLLCEMHVLRNHAKRLFPGEIEREFLEDVNELGDISIGIERQQKVVERIRWAYAKWMTR
jgi:nuclear-control-of-ATPase protein 2